jgi:hypothetical protein
MQTIVNKKIKVITAKKELNIYYIKEQKHIIIMSNEIRIIIVSSSVIIALIGLVFVIKIWMVWKQVNKNLLKARVFLNSNFLMKNWIFVFLAGAFIAMRRVMQLLELLEFQKTGTPAAIIFDLMGLAVIILLVLLAYHWYRLVYSTIN